MTMNITPINDAESARQKRNLTDSQKKVADATKEGVVINTFIRNPDMNDVYNSMVISANTKMPEKLKEKETTPNKSLLTLSLISTGVMAVITGISFFAKKSIKINKEINPQKGGLSNTIRNINMNDEETQSIYQIVHCPNKKTILAGVGVITLGSMAFIGKMFMDGFKEVWVKKREADIQKNLQEKLIAVETQSFSGKIQIIRSMLSEKAKELGAYICPTCKPTEIAFKGKINDTQGSDKSPNSSTYFTIGALTIGAIAALGFLSIRNLTKGKKELEKYIELQKNNVEKIVKKSSKNTKTEDSQELRNILQSIEATPEFIQENLSKLNWETTDKDKFIKTVSESIQKSTTDPPEAIGGSKTPKPAFNTYTNTYKAFLYNYILDSDNPQFAMLFYGITGLSALTYGGKVLGEGVKEVQVKKMNAQTELELQQRLVSTELRNFKAKKDAAINPLCEEFYLQVEKGKPKAELKTMAENILFEVKNGPPFVYS